MTDKILAAGWAVFFLVALVVAPVYWFVTPDFDGELLYRQAFEAVRDNHLELADPERRAVFVKEWEHKFDESERLDTEAGTDAAVREMVKSLDQRFDYYLGPDETAAMCTAIDARIVGIGVAVRLAEQRVC